MWAYDIHTGKTELKEVLNVYVHDQTDVLHLHTTAGDIRELGDGWQVIHDPTSGNSYHIAIIPQNGAELIDELALALSRLFKLTPNIFKK